MAGDIALIVIPIIVIVIPFFIFIQERRRHGKFRARLKEIKKRRSEIEKVIEKEIEEIQFIQRLEERGF